MLMEYYWNSWRKLWDNNILINDVVVGDQWPNHLHGNGPMDSVQVGRAVFVKESYTTLGIEPSTFSYPGRYSEPLIVSVGLKKHVAIRHYIHVR